MSLGAKAIYTILLMLDAKVYDEKGQVIGRLKYPVEVSRDHLYAELEFFTRFLGAKEVK